MSVERTDVGKSTQGHIAITFEGKLSKLAGIKSRGKIYEDLADVKDWLWGVKKSKKLRTTEWPSCIDCKASD